MRPIEDTSTASTSQWTKHPDLYLTDGTLVLLAGNTLFRVYGGLLSRYSEVFSDMASLSPHQPSDAETYEECPLVRLSDFPKDLAHFLNAFMDINYFPGSDQAISFRVVSGVLRLSTKYMVSTLRARSIAHMRRIMPVTFDEVNKLSVARVRAVFGSKKGDKPSVDRLVTLLRECNVLQLLPWAYYLACQRGFDSLLRGLTRKDDTLRLSLGDTCIALRGWRALTAIDSNVTVHIFSAGAESCRKAACSEGSRFILLRDTLRSRGDAVTFKRRERFGTCTACATHFRSVEEIEMRKAWTQLPSCFELPPWEILLQEQ